MNSQQQEIPENSAPQDAPREEIQSLRNQLEEKNNLLIQKDQEIETLNVRIREFQASGEENRVLLLAKDDQINQKNHDIEGLRATIRQVTVGFTDLQALETIFNETNLDVMNSIYVGELDLASIKPRIEEHLREKFTEQYNLEIEAMKDHCRFLVGQCRGKITGLEAQIAGILNIMSDDFGAYDEQQRIAAVAPAKVKKEQQEVLQGNFIALQNKLQERVIQERVDEEF